MEWDHPTCDGAGPRQGASASRQDSASPCWGKRGTNHGSGWHLASRIRHDGWGCYGAGKTLQCLLLPEQQVVAKEHTAKAKGSPHALEYRPKQTKCYIPHPPHPPKKYTYCPDFQHFSWQHVAASPAEMRLWLMGCDFVPHSCHCLCAVPTTVEITCLWKTQFLLFL